MSDLIERDKAIEKLKENVVEMGGDDFSEMGVHIDDIESVINSIPSARPKGENLCKKYPTLFECSLCGASCDDTVPWDCDINFCPNCGADMSEREGE